MSMKLTAQAMDVRTGNPLRKLVLLKLCDNANDRGVCWPSVERIAQQCEISERSVITHIGALVELGFVAVINRAVNGKRITNRYFIDLSGRLLTEKPPAVEDSEQENEPLGCGENNTGRGAGAALLKPVICEPVQVQEIPCQVQEIPKVGAGAAPKPVSEPVNKATNQNLLVHGYPDWFETLWKNYPPRIGSQDKRKAYSACCARLKSGVAESDLHAALARYVIFIRATGNWGTQFVLQAATFFGPGGHIENPWLVGPVGGGRPGGGAGPPGSRSTRDVPLVEMLTDRSWAK